MKSINENEFKKLTADQMNYVQGGFGTTKTVTKSWNDDGKKVDKCVEWTEDTTIQ